jgi:hypothetical protein
MGLRAVKLRGGVYQQSTTARSGCSRTSSKSVLVSSIAGAV